MHLLVHLGGASALSVAAGPPVPLRRNALGADSIRMRLDYDAKLKLVQAGLAIPGMEAEGREASESISSRLKAAGVVEIGEERSRTPVRADAERVCTQEAPCELDGDLAKRLLLTPGPVVLLLAFAYSVGVAAFETEDEDWYEKLEKRAERSRQRRREQQLDLARRLEPLQQTFGWSLVREEDGMPTLDAYVFLTVAVSAQLALALAFAGAMAK